MDKQTTNQTQQPDLSAFDEGGLYLEESLRRLSQVARETGVASITSPKKQELDDEPDA